MTRKRRRLYIAFAGLLCVATAAALILTAFEDNLVFFYSPSDVQAKGLPEGRTARIGGLVEEGSVEHLDDDRVEFVVTDGAHSLPVVYQGALPDLFREGQGVVAEGQAGDNGVFQAREILARHDENYMPAEVADALKESGEWRPETGEDPAEAKSR
ncbi:cytochrome c maturation protein CcmE [Fodinicurvata halophila]|uniref:Cytochrome c-type biogenesis protein CcmE n=1 Tax=Fodinicurvata halophila TaxID=1419723 RepID=A0ABV8UMU3_9PROT